LAKETSRKLQTRVACDTYDYEITYLKNVITQLRGQIQELQLRSDSHDNASLLKLAESISQTLNNKPNSEDPHTPTSQQERP
jgi:hypothetical protein